MDKQEVVENIICWQLGIPREILDRTMETAGADSLDYVEITMQVEEHFDVELRDEDLENIDWNNDPISKIAIALSDLIVTDEYQPFYLKQMTDCGENRSQCGDWSSDESFEFELAYDSFSEALDHIKLGKRVTRNAEGWEDKYIFLVSGSTFAVSRAPLNEFFEEGTPITYHPHIDVKYPNGTVGVWSPTQEDILATDWYQL